MKKKDFKLKSKVFQYPGMGGWFFIGVSKKESAQIKESFGSKARGWGSLRVAATIGKTTWASSIFPDKKSGTYLLPVKADVRKKEGIAHGDTIKFGIVIK